MEITKYRELNKGNLLGFASVKISKWGFYINDLAIFSKNGNRWINFPSRSYESPEGTKYASYCGFEEKEMKSSFDSKFFECLDKYLQDQPSKEESSSNFKPDDMPF